MSFLVLYLSTALIFLVVDAIGLSLLIRPLFERHVGDLLVPGFRVLPAALFYMFYVGVLVWLVTWPALNEQGYGKVLLNAALIGAMAYGTYEFTNLATLKPWHWTMVAADVAWGTVLTTVAAAGGVYVTRALL